MSSKTYYGFLDAHTNVASSDNAGNEIWKGFCTFMGHLTASNVATLIAWNSGATCLSGSFNTRGYWDETRMMGNGAHTVWKMHTSSTRNWEWYLYAQIVSGASANVAQSFNMPMSGYASTGGTLAGSSGNRGILIQAVLCTSGAAGTSSFNPWSGSLSTGSDGSSTAGYPRWISGSTGLNQLYCLPRSNDLGGPATAVLQKANGVIFANMFVSTTTLQFNFIYDGDAMISFIDSSPTANLGTYGIGYVGAFEMRNSLTASGFGGGRHGFAMYTQATPQANTMAVATTFGDLLGTATAQNGGISVPLGQMVSGSKNAIANTVATFAGVTYQPNTITGQYDEFPIYIGANDTPNVGLLGVLNTGLIKYAHNAKSEAVLADNSRAFLGGSVTQAEFKITVPWTGSRAPGVGLSRTGSLYTWTRDYG